MSNRLKGMDPQTPARLYEIVEISSGETRYVGCTTSSWSHRRSTHQHKGTYRPGVDRMTVIAMGPLAEMRAREVELINKRRPILNVHHNPRYGLSGEQMLPDRWPRKNASTHPDAEKRRNQMRAWRARRAGAA